MQDLSLYFLRFVTTIEFLSSIEKYYSYLWHAISFELTSNTFRNLKIEALRVRTSQSARCLGKGNLKTSLLEIKDRAAKA